MYRTYKAFPILLVMFDGGEGGAPAAGGDGGTPATVAQQPAVEAKVVYGKPPVDSVAESKPDKPDRNAAFRELISGEYKDLYDAEISRAVNGHIQANKQKEGILAKHAPILDALEKRYGVQHGDIDALQAAIDSDDAMWADAADEAGMSIEQYRSMQKLQRENEDLRTRQNNALNEQRAQQQTMQWLQQADQLRRDPLFRQFDLAAEIQASPKFLSLLQHGVDVKSAYTALHPDAVMGNVAQAAAKQVEKSVVGNIRARGNRPQENGNSAHAGITYKSDPSKWSEQDFSEVLKRVKRGEKVFL